VKRPSDANALTAVLAWERCQEMAARSPDQIVRDAWLRDAEKAWEIMQRWLGEPAHTSKESKPDAKP
jgi:hypothetical protein